MGFVNDDYLGLLEDEIRQEMVEEKLIERQSSESSVGLITFTESEDKDESEDINWHI